MKNSRLEELIEYIENHLKYGTTINAVNLNNLLKAFNIKGEIDRSKILEELKSLNIEVINHNELRKQQIKLPLKKIDNTQSILEEDLDRWFLDENIDRIDQRIIRDNLIDKGYKITKRVDLSEDSLDFLNDLDWIPLDELLIDDKFQQEIDTLESPVDKSQNISYLITLHNDSSTEEKKKEMLSNLVKANSRLVWKIVKYYKKSETPSFTEEDMYQLGMMGLLKAAERFEVEKGFQFSTYATWWIKQAIARGIADYSTMIRVPIHMRENVQKYIRKLSEYWGKFGKEPTNGELANLLDVSEEEVENYKVYQEYARIVSLDVPVSEEGDSKLGDFLPDNSFYSPEYEMFKIDLKETIEKVMEEKLTDKEETILSLRFGLNAGKAHTLEEIGQVLGVTRERIRQIQSKAIRKISRNKEIFEEFLNDY